MCWMCARRRRPRAGIICWPAWITGCAPTIRRSAWCTHSSSTRAPDEPQGDSPMPLIAPPLDTEKFEDIFRQARLRIPRYTPEWTDFNESDPGITLLQLFAWLTEMMLYKMNQVPERNYIKFLQLL